MVTLTGALGASVTANFLTAGRLGQSERSQFISHQSKKVLLGFLH